MKLKWDKIHKIPSQERQLICGFLPFKTQHISPEGICYFRNLFNLIKLIIFWELLAAVGN